MSIIKSLVSAIINRQLSVSVIHYCRFTITAYITDYYNQILPLLDAMVISMDYSDYNHYYDQVIGDY